jgi:ABC-type amino acid transport substrate-binding protein
MSARTCLFPFLVCLIAAACLGADGADGADRRITIATDATFPPFHFVDSAGRVTGFDVELARALLRRAGYPEPEVRVSDYNALFDGLLSGRHDIVAATTGVTAERQSRYLLSAPYFRTCQAVLVRHGENEPRTLDDLAGRKVGAAGAMTSAMALEGLADAVAVILTKSEVSADMIRDDGRVPLLESGAIDALVVDEFEAVDAARTSGGVLRVLAEPAALEQYALVLAPGDHSLKAALDASLDALRADGTLSALEQEFGLDRADDWPVLFDR